MKPILYNTEMVKAIMDGRKSVTRRVVKPVALGMNYEDGCPARNPPYRPGDILYVRETFFKDNAGKYHYKADGDLLFFEEDIGHGLGWQFVKWRPSIHMPKEAARLFLRVKDVRVERLQESFFKPGVTVLACQTEGIDIGDQCKECIGNYGNPVCIDENDGDDERECECGILDDIRAEFADLWDSTIKPTDRALYGWTADPWVWAIEFQRISKEEAEHGTAQV